MDSSLSSAGAGKLQMCSITPVGSLQRSRGVCVWMYCSIGRLGLSSCVVDFL